LQFSNVPEVRPARRLLIIGSVLFVCLFILNLAATIVSFAHHDSDRWLNAIRLLPNLVIAVLIWRGFVQLSMLAERAAVYKHAIEQDLPQLRAAVERTKAASAAALPADPATSPRRSTASPPAPADAPPEESCEPDSPLSG
jgi:hypothetical protein